MWALVFLCIEIEATSRACRGFAFWGYLNCPLLVCFSSGRVVFDVEFGFGEKNMLRSCDQEDDMFFDSVDSFRSVSVAESSVEFDYQIWESEPVSVRERRDRFLRGMGLLELHEGTVSSTESVGLDRIADCTDALSSTCCPVVDRNEGHPSCSGRGLDLETKFYEPEQNMYSMQVTGFEPGTTTGSLPIARQLTNREATAHCEERQDQHTIRKKNIKTWWNHFVQKGMKERMPNQGGSIVDHKAHRTKVGRCRKSCKEFTAVYMKQQIQGHKGFIWTMKFSPDGQYLASGGEDGVVRIWRVTSAVASCEYFTPDDTSTLSHEARGRKLIPGRNRSKPAAVIIPRRIFNIDESPLHEFHGHTDDVLDLCWSKSNCLLSSSKDETVRLWQVGSDECLQVFNHNNYVTCIQFNPIDDGYFISGSIDGKVRVWRVSERRVVDWADVRDIITAICYQPDGQGFIVGSISGHCRFYDASGHNLQLDAQICVQGRKKSASNRITGLQYSPEDAQKVMITSADSKVRIFDGLDIIHKYRGLRKSGCQMSASFTPNGRHIISVGEDSRVYVWNYDGLGGASSKQAKSIRSCEHFFSEGVSVAVPWSGMEREAKNSRLEGSLETVDHLVTSSLVRDSVRFSLGGWFSKDGRLRGLATWPEEKLPLWSGSVAAEEEDEHEERDHEHSYYHPHQDHQQQQEKHHHPHNHNHSALCSTWGLVIVTAGWDGMIRTFHNYGLPVRL